MIGKNDYSKSYLITLYDGFLPPQTLIIFIITTNAYIINSNPLIPHTHSHLVDYVRCQVDTK